VLASFNIQSGRNGGLEAALRAMDQLGVDIGFLMETKLTGGIYTRHSLGYDVHQKQHHVPYSLAILINGICLLIHGIASTLWAFQYVFSSP
jgi:hypothetical protein